MQARLTVENDNISIAEMPLDYISVLQSDPSFCRVYNYLLSVTSYDEICTSSLAVSFLHALLQKLYGILVYCLSNG